MKGLAKGGDGRALRPFSPQSASRHLHIASHNVVSLVVACLRGLRRALSRLVLVVSLALLTATSCPAWGESLRSAQSVQHAHDVLYRPETCLMARADASAVRGADDVRGRQQQPQASHNVRAWRHAWGGALEDLPLWTKMARERVVMQALVPAAMSCVLVQSLRFLPWLVCANMHQCMRIHERASTARTNSPLCALSEFRACARGRRTAGRLV